MSNAIQVRLLASEEYPGWNDFISTAIGGTIYSHTQYLDILSRATGGRFRVVGIFNAEKLIGGVALFERQTGSWWYVQNRLLLYYNGVVLSPETHGSGSRAALACAALSEKLKSLKFSRVVLHCLGAIHDFRGFLSTGWTCSPTYTYVVRTPNGEAAWNKVDKNQRRLIRKAREAQITLRRDRNFDEFYRLHQMTHERKGAPLYLRKDMFESFVRELEESKLGYLYRAVMPSGKTAASQLVLQGKFSRAHTICAGAEPEFQSLGATPFLRWQVIETLVAEGYSEHDLTDAALGSVTRFKEQLGGDLQMNMVLRLPDRASYRIAEACRALPGRLRSKLSQIAHSAEEKVDGEG